MNAAWLQSRRRRTYLAAIPLDMWHAINANLIKVRRRPIFNGEVIHLERFKETLTDNYIPRVVTRNYNIINSATWTSFYCGEYYGAFEYLAFSRQVAFYTKMPLCDLAQHKLGERIPIASHPVLVEIAAAAERSIATFMQIADR